MTSRRAFLMGIAGVLFPSSAAADVLEDAAVRAEDVQRLRNRVELWQGFASRSQNLLARYVSIRHSSLLAEPLVSTGTLMFVAPDRLVFHDDTPSGSTTELIESGLRIVPNGGGPAIALDHDRAAAARWLAHKLRCLLGAGTVDELLTDAKAAVPRGSALRLELLPMRGSPTRRTIRSLLVRFEPLGGAVVELELAEARGDRVHMTFSDHRQNLAADQLDTVRARMGSVINGHTL